MKHAKLGVSMALVLALVGMPAVVVLAQTPPPPSTERRIFTDLRDDKDRLIERSEAQGPLKDHFDEIDTNKDGKLSHEELMAFHKTHGPPGGDCLEVSKSKGSKNKSGRGGPPPLGPPPPGANMAMLDKNSDGKLSRDEFLKGQSDLFDRLDVNKDGFLTAEERPEPRHREVRCLPPGDMPPPPPQ